MKKVLLLVATGALAISLMGCSTAPKEPAAQKSEATPSVQEKAPAEPTASQKTATAKAKDYLELTGFSHSGLVKQLGYDKFSAEDATFAADNCGADWDVQAEKKAADYLKLTPLSHDGLVDQLVFDGFTAEQAEHGAASTGL